jgi:hypothetical protein
MASRSRRGRRRSRSGGVRDFLSDHRGVVVVCVLVVVVVAAAITAKVLAERAAESQTQERAEQVRTLLEGATPEDFLAFNAGVKTPGSVAQRVRDQPDFVNVRATADLSFIRFEPDGWWSGFTERCVVAEVTPSGVRVRVPKTACVRVQVPSS